MNPSTNAMETGAEAANWQHDGSHQNPLRGRRQLGPAQVFRTTFRNEENDWGHMCIIIYI